MNEVIRTENLLKVYNEGMSNEVIALDRVNIKIKKGDFVAITGPSGSGKSTLLHMLGVLDKPTSGKVIIDDIDVSELSDDEKTEIRREKIGFVFQQFNLIPLLTAIENVEMPIQLSGKDKTKSSSRALELLKIVNLENRRDHFPNQLSGGQQQRVAIARSLANDPNIILADEPTGNLDSKTSQEIVKLLKDLNLKGYTIVVVTHDASIAKFASKKVYMRDGKVDNHEK
ncbi:MAG: ABC transporter ATP-binding protein [Candidatus Aenigmarchaeota archaeon]|nr:ABC transporter ATP-binding protein [Candidatus Aenigmarchaeota archaeon]